MDKRHLLLADQYDKLGLYKVADNLDFIKLSQNTSDPARGGLDDPKYPVQKPKPVAVPKKDTKKETTQQQEPFFDIDQQIREKKRQNELKENVENYTGPASLLFLASEINNLSKEATQHYLLKVLEDLASKKTITPADMSKLEKVLSKVKAGNNINISKPVLEMLEDAAQGIKPNLSEVKALVPKNPNLVQNTKDFIAKLKNLAAKKPGEAALAEDVAQKIGTKIPAFQQALKLVPMGLLLLNAYFLYPAAKQYYTTISQGKINEIWKDPLKRAQFIVFLADIISSVTVFFPPLAPLSLLLAGISLGYQGGMWAFDRYNEITGNTEKDTELEKLNIYDDELRKLEEKGLNIFESDAPSIVMFINNLPINAEAKYALKLIIPDLNIILQNAVIRKKENFKLMANDVMNLPVLKQGKYKKNRKGQLVKVAVEPQFLKDTADPKNMMAFYDFQRGLSTVLSRMNMNYSSVYEMYKNVKFVKK